MSRPSTQCRRTTSTPLALGLGVSLLVAACAPERDSGPALQVTDSAGITIAEATGSEQALDWSAERLFTISPLEEEGDGFYSVSGVAVVDGSRIVVLDRDGHRLVQYDADGTHLAQAGRQGSGPGEFQFPISIMPREEGGVSVFDIMNARIDLFDASLQHDGTNLLDGINYYGGTMAEMDGIRVFSSTDPETPASELIVAVSPTDTVEVVRDDREPGRVVVLESCGMQLGGAPPLFAPRTRWSPGPGGSVVVSSTDRFEIDVYRAPDFALERRIRRNVPVLEASAELALASLGEGMSVMTPSGVRECDKGEVVEQRGFAPVIPPISDLIVAPTGEIFVRRWTPPDQDPAIDVLSAEGAYLGTLPAGFPFPDGFLGNDRMVVTEEDEMGLTSVAVYRIVQ